MAILTGAQMITEARRDCVDTDTFDPAFIDNIYLTKINKYYLLWHQKIERRISRVTALASGYTIAGSVLFGDSNGSNLDWYEIVTVYRAPSDSATVGAPIEITRLDRVLRLQDSSPTEQAAITLVAFQRMGSAAVGAIGSWRVYVWPIPNVQNNLLVYVRRWPTVLAVGDTPDVTELGAYTISKLAAAEIAGMMGEDEAFIAHILRDVPDEIMTAMDIPRPPWRHAPMEERVA